MDVFVLVFDKIRGETEDLWIKKKGIFGGGRVTQFIYVEEEIDKFLDTYT